MKVASDKAVDFVASLLDHNPMRRPTAVLSYFSLMPDYIESIALRHAWMTGDAEDQLPLSIDRFSCLQYQRKITRSLERILNRVKLEDLNNPTHGVSLEDHFGMIDASNCSSSLS